MVQNVIEPLNVNVIKVTIKDKPGLQNVTVDEEGLKKAFEALKQYAQQERRIRELRSAIYERNTKRRLRHCFDTWCNFARTMRSVSEYTKIDSKVTNDKKIELFVSAIAEKQKEIVTGVQEKPEPEKKRTSKSKSAPLNLNKTAQTFKRKRTLSGAIQIKDATGAPAQSRLEAQKMIIEEQRAKLAEQSKFLQEIKLKELDQEARRTSKQTITVAKQALNQCDQRTRRSLIHLMREEGCRDKTIIEIPRIPSPPRFLIRMEARAEARKQRMKQTFEIRQRKREEEKKKQEISRREAEEKERLQQIQALKEAKKLRREQEIRRLKDIEKNRRLEYLADQFYRRYLFRRYVLEPLISLVEEKYQRLQRADQHYGETLLIKVFSAWKGEWVDQRNEKLQLANKFYRHNLLWYTFDDWKTFALDMKQKHQVAIDFYEMKLQGKCIKAWHLLCVKAKVIMHEKEVKAIKRYERYVKGVYFNIWKQYMSISDDIKEREQRRDEWRDLIQKFIPDALKLKNASLDSLDVG